MSKEENEFNPNDTYTNDLVNPLEQLNGEISNIELEKDLSNQGLDLCSVCGNKLKDPCIKCFEGKEGECRQVSVSCGCEFHYHCCEGLINGSCPKCSKSPMTINK